MSLADDLQEAVAATTPPCKLCMAMESMPEEEVDALNVALSSTLGGKQISVILKRNGYDIGLPTVSTHRKEGHQ